MVLASAQKSQVRIYLFISSNERMSFINKTSAIFSFAKVCSFFNLSNSALTFNAAFLIINCWSLSNVAVILALSSSYSFFLTIDCALVSFSSLENIS